MTKWPSKKQINSVFKTIEKSIASRPLSSDATTSDKVKYSICEQFVRYINARCMTQQELARKLEVDKSLVSKIVHYHFDDFTIDRLINYLAILDPNLVVEIKARVA